MKTFLSFIMLMGEMGKWGNEEKANELISNCILFSLNFSQAYATSDLDRVHSSSPIHVLHLQYSLL